jgi:hypothetical protein
VFGLVVDAALMRPTVSAIRASWKRIAVGCRCVALSLAIVFASYADHVLDAEKLAEQPRHDA